MSDDIDKAVLKNYEVHQKLGKGAYGIVWRATHKKDKEQVALKKVFDAFQNSTDAQRTYREVVYLMQMEHENIIRLRDVCKAANDKDLYLIFEYMETDLHATIRANILEEIHKQYIMYQAFKALDYMHRACLIHRDMKPANLLLNSECLMKVADFGLARSLTYEKGSDVEEANVMTDYVATRWYRAPEILVGSSTYGVKADLWSLGCIFGEMLNGKPVFNGTSTLNQLEVIAELVGQPGEEELESLSTTFASKMFENIYLTDEAKQRLASTTLKERFQAKFPTATDDAIELIMSCLSLDPAKRIAASEGMLHPYCVQFHDDAGVTVPQGPVHPTPKAATEALNLYYEWPKDNVRVLNVKDNTKLKMDDYREMLYSICRSLTERISLPGKMPK